MINKVQARAKALHKQHGTWKAAAISVGLDPGNLHKIASGKLARPSAAMLDALGFELSPPRAKR